jgi:hypothetical protein
MTNFLTYRADFFKGENRPAEIPILAADEHVDTEKHGLKKKTGKANFHFSHRGHREKGKRDRPKGNHGTIDH